MKKISVFANFFINDQERFCRMKDSFFSFYKANINNWVINVRGVFSSQVVSFLKKNIKKNFYIFNIDSGDWFRDSRQISKFLKSKYVFFWTEDHLCLQSTKKFNDIINEIAENNIDYLTYSWFLHGLTYASYENIPYKTKKNIIYLNYNKQILKKRLNWFCNKKIPNNIDYIISQQSIMKIKLFNKLINNKYFFTLFRRNVPFAFEKNYRFTSWLPYKLGVVKKEFFASIDDDHNIENYSLISRNKYPDRYSISDKVNIKKKRINSSDRYNFLGQIYYSNFFRKIKILLK